MIAPNFWANSRNQLHATYILYIGIKVTTHRIDEKDYDGIFM